MITFIIYLLGIVATAILIFIAVKEHDEITLFDLFLGIIISLASWFGFMFISLIEYGEVVIYKRKK